METLEDAERYVKLNFTLDAGISHRTAIGLVVLATDHTIEYEWRKLLAIEGVGFYESRILNSAEITAATLKEMDRLIAPGVALIRPGERLDVVAFGCTSASMVLGEGHVINRIKESRPDAACTTPITAARVALNSLGAQRVALLTPYLREITESMKDYLVARGINVVRMGSFEHSDDNEVARIDAQSVRNAVIELGRQPVTSSNHAMAWHALRLGGVKDELPQFGRLFTVQNAQ
jgi:maleate isomerase